MCDVDKVEFTSSNGDEGFATVRGRRLSRQEPLGTLTLALTLTLTLTSTLTLTLTLTLIRTEEMLNISMTPDSSQHAARRYRGDLGEM